MREEELDKSSNCSSRNSSSILNDKKALIVTLLENKEQKAQLAKTIKEMEVTSYQMGGLHICWK